MPRENRKRGKKHRKQPEQVPEHQVNEEELDPIVESLDQPSWIISGLKEGEEADPGAPYGYVDADVKTYFRTVDVQIRDWQEKRDEGAGEIEDTDPNERMLLLS